MSENIASNTTLCVPVGSVIALLVYLAGPLEGPGLGACGGRGCLARAA